MRKLLLLMLLALTGSSYGAVSHCQLSFSGVKRVAKLTPLSYVKDYLKGQYVEAVSLLQELLLVYEKKVSVHTSAYRYRRCFKLIKKGRLLDKECAIQDRAQLKFHYRYGRDLGGLDIECED